MAGYSGFSMSKNAVSAYETGEKPLSKWTKSAIFEEIYRMIEDGDLSLNCSIDLLKKLPATELKSAVLSLSSWHHTSCKYNRTDFYSISAAKCEKLSDKGIEEKLAFLKNSHSRPLAKSKVEVAPVIAECRFLEWNGSAKHPKATEITEIGEIKGSWFFRKDGTKKSVSAKGFQIIRTLSPEEVEAIGKSETESTSTCGSFRTITVQDAVTQYHLPVERRVAKDGKDIAIVTFGETDRRVYPADSLSEKKLYPETIDMLDRLYGSRKEKGENEEEA